MAPTCVQGAFAKFALKRGTGDVDFSSGATRLPFDREFIGATDTVDVPNSIWGTRSEPSERGRRGPLFVGGQIFCPISPVELDTLLPLILGADESTNVFALAETIPTFAILLDKVSKIYKYKDGVVDKAVFRGVQSGPGRPPNFIVLMMEMLFMDEDDVTSHVFPSIDLGITSGYYPYVFEDSVVTLGNTVYSPKAWAIMINNFVDQRRVNNLKPVTNCPTNRAVSAQFSFSADADNLALRKVATAGLTTNTIALTQGSLSTTFTFGALQAPRKTPFIIGKRESGFDINFHARSVSTTKELSVTNVSA